MYAFTICSNNYIYKAQVLSDSIRTLSNADVYLFLADASAENIPYDDLNFNKVIRLEELDIPNLQWMIENYNVVEMNTAIKPFAFRFMFENTPAEEVYFFDPDVKVYQPLEKFGSFWEKNDILLTPHILTPIPLDGKFPAENLFLNHGIYNLGFLGLKRGDIADRLLTWWSERMQETCIVNYKEGYFVDQLWFNLVPLLFQSSTVITQHGWNVSYWNLHERELSCANGEYRVNRNQLLYFYHFSHLDTSVHVIHTIENFRYTFEGRAALRKLYQEYVQHLMQFDGPFFKNFLYFNGKYPLAKPVPSLFDRLVKKIKAFC